MKKRVLSVILTSLFYVGVSGQVNTFNAVDLHPVSPTAFQFLKYSEIPVSEYTGVPNINVPLYEVNVDGVKIPIQLNYHSQGNKVSAEASWVGLGWDLSMGSIVQQINDRDDYGVDPITGIQNVKMIPDYFPSMGDGSPTPLPIRYLLPTLIRGFGWSSPYPVNTLQPSQGFAYATDFSVPVNGEFDIRQYDLFNTNWYDSEPDIFTANFFGETVKFIIDFNNNPLNNSIIVLNKPGYVVTKTTNGFSILNSSGNAFFFEIQSIIQSQSFAENFQTNGPALGSSSYEPTTKIFFLTKIITKNKKSITFQYNTTSSFESYPNYSDKFIKLSNRNIGSSHAPMGGIDGNYFQFDYDGQASNEGKAYINYAFNKENYVFLSSILWEEGQLTFNNSDRQDINGSKKLDNIVLSDFNSNYIKSWQFDYSYFDARNVLSNEYQYPDGANLSSENRSFLRLQLLDVKQPGGEIYSFRYNTTTLPKKNSFAQDFWGYYNGQTSNTSLAPDPAIFNHPELGTNGNNRFAILANAKAGILEQIIYPTGGTANFEYELNEFSKSQIPDFPTNQSTILGSGLRIKSISLDNIVTNKITKTGYSYVGGKLITPMQLSRQVPFNTIDSYRYGDFDFSYWTYNEFSANGVFSSNPLASINGVGYDMVIKQNIDEVGTANGRIETQYSNSVDTYNPTISMRAISCGIPVVKSISNPENGSILTRKIFDSQNNLLKNDSTIYIVRSSVLRYGARIFGGKQLYFFGWEPGAIPVNNYIKQNLIGYYPIFDVVTLVDQSFETTYDRISGVALNNRSVYSYDGFNQLVSKEDFVSNNGFITTNYTYPYSNASNPSIITTGEQALWNANRLSEITKIERAKHSPNWYPYTKTDVDSKEYVTLSDKVVTSKILTNPHPGVGEMPSSITYDVYDPINANPLQYTNKGVIHTILWGYKGQHIVAEIIGADYNSINAIITDHTVLDNPTSDLSLRNYLNNLRTSLPNAIVSTYTYAPLKGVTSQTDASGHTSYYEYDALGRLALIRDKDQNILKKYDYLYQNTAPAIVAWNDMQSGTYTKSCPIGYTGSSYTTIAAAHTFGSSLDITDANRQALAYISSIGQSNADINGTCTASASLVVKGTNPKSFPFYVGFTNTSTGINYGYTIYPGMYNSNLASIPAGTYNITIYPMGGPSYGSYGFVVSGFFNSGYTIHYYNLSLSSNFTVANVY